MCEKTSSSRPRAVISRSALAAASTAAVDAGGRVADLRRDAWGHGVLAIAHAVTAAGAAAVLVDHSEEVEALRLEGIEALTEGVADIDASLLYGLPDADGTLRTTPVMRLAGRVLSTKPLKAGDAVSYGYTHRATQDTTAALITGGYAQGIVRALGNAATVEIAGASRPIVGRVAMDVCVIDLQGSDDVELGEDATYFGGRGSAGPGLARWSAVTGLTIAELIAVAGSHADRGWEA
ncbi:alanine racemase [Microbacterium phyllosphaerae]|uniref:Alanine racemase n=1 Tax=Microbacterium phyllosphaerae TaxID=124798 RepID=A0ABS4WRR9_9MICO|nr:alanine racemase C-terminal domain-containing protein [Microbacterium phyllosphaerae]MBP2378913.1 alanine racemase [Microbacterium phyllosphaerae]